MCYILILQYYKRFATGLLHNCYNNVTSQSFGFQLKRLNEKFVTFVRHFMKHTEKLCQCVYLHGVHYSINTFYLHILKNLIGREGGMIELETL